MTGYAAVAIGVLAVAPFVALVLYLVLRAAPTQAIEAAAPAPVADTGDLLAEREAAEFESAAHELKVRHAVQTAADEAALVVQNAHEKSIDWSEAVSPYRPGSIDPAALLASLHLPPDLSLAREEHRVFINRPVLEQVTAHLQSNTTVELGGLLVGLPYYASALDAYLVVVRDSYSAEGGKETPVSFEYTSDTWHQLTPKLQGMPAEYVVVGSYHSHPGLGVFLSSTDIDTQVNVFSQEWQVALVIDPIRNETAFFISQAGVPVKFDLFG